MLLLVDALRFCGQAGRRVRLDQGRKKDIPGVEAGQHQPRNEGAFVHIADGAAQLVGHDDENERGRNDLRQRAGGCDHARGDPPVVAVAQHDGQRDQAHCDDRRRNNARRRRQQRADEDDRVGKAAAHGPEQLADGVEEVLGHPRPFQHEAHEGEEGNGEQDLVAHGLVDALGEGLQQRPRQRDGLRRVRGEFDGDDEEQKAVRGEREGDRVAEQQKRH